MSYNPYSQTLTPEVEQAMRHIASNVYAEKKMTTVNYNPETDTYHQSLTPHLDTFDWDHDPQITKPGEWTKSKIGLTGASSSTDVDHYKYQPFRDEFLPQAASSTKH